MGCYYAMSYKSHLIDHEPSADDHKQQQNLDEATIISLLITFFISFLNKFILLPLLHWVTDRY